MTGLKKTRGISAMNASKRRNPLKDWCLRSLRAAWWTVPALAIAGAIAANVSALAEGPASGTGWIDVHVHLIGGRGPVGQDYQGAVEAALTVMEQEGIRKMIVMPPPQVQGNPPPFDSDSFATALKRHPSRFAFLGGGGSLNPMLQDAAQEAQISDGLRRRFEQKAIEILQQGAMGFGEITAHHLSHTSGHPYESVAADHPLLLLLADIAARHDVVVDFHFDVAAEETKLPDVFASPPNPAVLHPNLAAFERLLAHNRTAKIVWAHAGSDMLGHWTVDLSRRLLAKHPNLYMSLRMAPGRAPQNHPLTPARQIKPEWLRLLQDFPDRFVMGGDQFIPSPSARGSGPGLVFAQRAGGTRERSRMFLAALPPELALKISHENAIQLYKLKD